MKTFSYTAVDLYGNRVKSIITAESLKDVNTILTDKGFTNIRISEHLTFGKNSQYKIKTKDLAICCRQLSSMMVAGLTIIKSLDILYKQQEKEQSRQIWRTIYEDVQKGKSFSEAIKEQTGTFPDFFISMVSAGEISGNLDQILVRLSDHYAKENRLNNKIKSSMIYPIILLVASIVVVVGLFTFIMPTFRDLAGESEVPALTQFMFGVSDALRNYWYIFLIIIAILVVVVIYCFKTPSTRYKIDRHFINSKWIGHLLGKIYTGRFARSLSSLYSSGIPMVESLERSSAVIGNSFITAQFESVINDVKQGAPLSLSIQKTEVFDAMFCSMLFVGEESGDLDGILAKTADYYEEESDAAITKLVSMIEPLMICFLGVIVGLVVASIYPMLTNAQNVS